jgi:hypothetical protein
MSGRGDNNKQGSAGRGASNQSNQPFIADGEKQPRSNHDMTGSTAEPSIEQDKATDADANRDTGSANAQPRSVKTTQSRTFNLLVDDVPYVVTASPFTFNEEIRYNVSVNGSTEHIFTWDSELKMIRAIDDDAVELPGSLEEAISERLQSKE